MFYQENAGLIAGSAKQICKTLRDTLYQAEGFSQWLTSQADADLSGLGFSASDITTLRGAFADLHTLNLLAYGQAAPSGYGITGTYDFSQHIKEVTGVTG